MSGMYPCDVEPCNVGGGALAGERTLSRSTCARRLVWRCSSGRVHPCARMSTHATLAHGRPAACSVHYGAEMVLSREDLQYDDCQRARQMSRAVHDPRGAAPMLCCMYAENSRLVPPFTRTGPPKRTPQT